jgi:hypothetical protein
MGRRPTPFTQCGPKAHTLCSPSLSEARGGHSVTQVIHLRPTPKVKVCPLIEVWLRGGLQWRAEVDFPPEVSMLWGHVASCRLTRPWRSRIARSSVDLRHRLCRTRDLVILDLLWRRGVLKKRQRTGPGMMRGPVWGGRQAAGKADSQAFRGKRLPHRWLGSSRTSRY